MVTVSYNSLLNLINNSQLTVGEKYKVSDYPTFQPILTARTTDELWRDGYTSEGYKLLYNPFNTDNEYNWASSYGWVYYLEANSNSAWCDWINDASSLITNSRNVHIGPYRTVSGWEIPQVSVEDSEDIVVSGFGDIAITNSRNITVGNSNSGTIDGSQNVTVGSDNTDLALQSALNCTIGDNNDTLSLSNVEGVNVNNRNTAITVQKGFNIVGSDNDNLLLNGEGNEVLNDCRGVSLNNGFNQVDASSFVEVDGKYNQVGQSDGVVLTGSVGNTVTDSRLVYLDDVNNNEVWANNYINSQAAYLLPDGETVRQYYPGDPEAFVRVANVNGNKVKKVVTNTIGNQRMQTDNAALVIDTVNNTRKNSTKTYDSYFIGNDGIWNAEGINTDEYDIILVISKTDSQKCYVSGAGRYQNGATCEIGYSWIEPGFEAVFTDENGNVHEGPYTIIVSENQKIYVTLTNATPQQVPFYIQDLSGANNTVRIRKSNTLAETITVYYSTDGTTWNSMGVTSLTGITATCPANGRLYLRATEDHWGKQNYYDYISCSGSYKIGGNIMSLLVGENYTDATMSTSETYILSSVFYGSTNLVDASDLVLPRNVGNHCYNNLFYGCTALTSTPSLIATTLAEGCYNGMFNGCSSLRRVVSYANDISATGCLTNWLSGVAVSGDFYKLGSATYTSGASGIPTGWNVHNIL